MSRGPARRAVSSSPVSDVQQGTNETLGEGPGSRLGPYLLRDVIGEGGFGTVFRAEQSQPVQRLVALKILKLGMDTRQVVARFEAERQALALMDHPAIAKVYDAGATETGRPYFVMELVEGESLTEYCDARRLETHERLQLFGDVCLAVQHAHQKGVLHRDLKPSNVLVTEVDGIPLPKVIDFGIAKAIERPLTDSTLATEAFQVMGTPEYMSPEQAAGRDVDTRADVYALGVMLYELLTGTRPFAKDGGGLDQLGELLRQIHEVTPPKPSTRVSELGKADGGQDSETRVLLRSLRGDLDWIVMKALEKDRERRYASASELADDIARHLENEPVLASPPSATYRLRKFVRRNRMAVGSAAVIALTLIGATIGLGVLYARSVASEARATREAETSRQALTFLTGMFEVSNPSEARGETVTAREILDRGAERIELELADQPAIRSTLMASIGDVYRGLGLYQRADELIGSAVTIREALYGAEHPETLLTESTRADVWFRQARFDESEELLRTTLTRQDRVLGPDHPDTISTRVTLAQVLERQSRFDEAEVLTRQALEAAERTLGAEHELALVAKDHLGQVYLSTGRYDDAEAQYQEALSVRRRTLGSDHPETFGMLANLAEVATKQGRFDEAEAYFLEAADTALRVYGPEHQNTLVVRQRLGLLYYDQSRFDEAQAIQESVVETQRRTLGDGHLDTLLSLTTLSAVRQGQGRLEEAESLQLECLEGLLALFGETNAHTLSAYGNLAILYIRLGRLEEAEAFGRQAHLGSVELLGEDHPDTLLRLENLGNVYFEQGNFDGLLTLLAGVLEGRRRALGNEHPAVSRTLVNLAVVFNAAGDMPSATAVREELLQRSLDRFGVDYESVAEELLNLSATRVGALDYEGAATSTEEALRVRRAVLGDADRRTLATMRDYVYAMSLAERWSQVTPHLEAFDAAHAAAFEEDAEETIAFIDLVAQGFAAIGDKEQAARWRARLPAKNR